MPYDPFRNGVEKWALDWLEGRLRVVEDSDITVILIEDKNGEFTVLNVIKRR